MGRRLASSKSKKNSSQDLRKRKKNAEKRRGRNPKRSVKRSRKSSRDSSSSCSTCRKSKLKKKKKKKIKSLKSRNRSLSCSTCSGSSSESIRTDIYREGRNRGQIGSSSVIDDEMITAVYDDSRISMANDGREVDYERGIEMDRWMSEGNVEKDCFFDRFECEEVELNAKVSSRIKSEIVAADKHDVESDDLELSLRQKALENLMKLRRGLSSDNKTIVDGKNDFAGIESSEKQCETVNKIISLPKFHSIVSEERDIQLGVSLPESKVNDFIQLPSMEANYSTSDKKRIFSRLNQSANSKQEESSISGQSTSNQLSNMEDSPEKHRQKKRETANKIIFLPKSHSSVSEERDIQLGVPPHDSKLNSVMQLPSMEANYSTSDKKRIFSRLNQNVNSKQVESSISGQSISNLPNDMEDSSEKMSHRQSPLMVSQEKNVTEVCGSGNSLHMSEVNLGDGKEKICEKNETLGEFQSGSEFEQKTFSRMHDGEMVQVSYKVYIPKKTPALARRKLQR